MSKVFVVAYDTSPASQRALEFAISMAKDSGASLLITHILDWSPYSFLTPQELEERHGRRKEELARADAAIIQPVIETVKKEGIDVTSEIRYGSIANTLIEIATENNAAQIIIGRAGDSGVVARLFGSVAGALAQASPVPCVIIP